MLKDYIFHCEGEGFKSSHLQPSSKLIILGEVVNLA